MVTDSALIILTWPVAHISVNPIRRLRAAAAKSVLPPGYSERGGSPDAFEGTGAIAATGDDTENHKRPTNELARQGGLFARISRWRGVTPNADSSDGSRSSRRRARETFKIPGKVRVRNHFIRDELTDLTQVFNEMSDELVVQYEQLEERVKQRTAELEHSKKAAEAANESKTLFIANICELSLGLPLAYIATYRPFLRGRSPFVAPWQPEPPFLLIPLHTTTAS